MNGPGLGFHAKVTPWTGRADITRELTRKAMPVPNILNQRPHGRACFVCPAVFADER